MITYTGIMMLRACLMGELPSCNLESPCISLSAPILELMSWRVMCRFDDATAYGHGNGIDDQSMGWSRYAQVPGQSNCMIHRSAGLSELHTISSRLLYLLRMHSQNRSLIFGTSVQGTTHLNLNSGFFYLQANERTVALMERIAARLAKEKAWDQV